MYVFYVYSSTGASIPYGGDEKWTILDEITFVTDV